MRRYVLILLHVCFLTTIFASHLKTLISAFHQWHDLQLWFSHRLSWNPPRRDFCCQDENVSVLHFLCRSTESASVSSSALRPAGHLVLAHSKQVLQGAQVLVKCYKLAGLHFNCVSECSTISPFQQKICGSCIFKLSVGQNPQMVPRVKFGSVCHACCLCVFPQLGRFTKEGQLFLGPLGSTAEDTRCVVDDQISNYPQLLNCDKVTNVKQKTWHFSQVRSRKENCLLGDIKYCLLESRI